MTFPSSPRSLDDKNPSIPAPDPKSTRVSPLFKSANCNGAPHPNPRIDSFGIDFNSVSLYPIIVDTCSFEMLFTSQHASSVGLQQELILPSNAIFP